MTTKFGSPEEVFASLSDHVSRLSGEALAANVLAATVIACLGGDADIAEQARALLAHVGPEGGDAKENARLMAIAEARLETLLGELEARRVEN